MNLDLSKFSDSELRAKMVQITNEIEFVNKQNHYWVNLYNQYTSKRFCHTSKLLGAKINLDHYSFITQLLEDYSKLLTDEQNKRNLK